MSTTGQNIINQINTWVRNYAVTAFHNMRLNAILLQLVQWIDSGGTTGSLAGAASVVPVTGSNFINATDCPLVALDGLSLAIFYNPLNRYITQAKSEWTPLVGGGFRITIVGFDATAINATDEFFVYPY